ncbi:Crp/Fnr family transcriptional regulator [Candidatus Latescibacterota bacterium]
MEVITILRELTNEQFESLLSICIKEEFPPYTVIIEEGTQSRHMYILTEGSLKVIFKGANVGLIVPVSTVGEIGVFTGDTRTAKIVSITNCTLLKIRKNELFDLFEKDKDFHIKFQKAMFLDVVHKLSMTNETIGKQSRYISKLEKGFDYHKE